MSLTYKNLNVSFVHKHTHFLCVFLYVFTVAQKRCWTMWNLNERNIKWNEE